MEGSRPDKKPNILLIQTDQLAAQVLPIYGHNVVKAPNIQKIADNGVTFDNAYCNFPLCAPSRMSMLTGRYAHSIGSWDNGAEQSASNPTIAHYLRKIGYETILCGKMHFIGPDQMHGFNKRLMTDIYPSNYAWTPDWSKSGRDSPSGISMRPVVEAGKCIRSMQLDYDDEVIFNGRQQIYDLARYSEDKPFFLTVSFTQPHSPFVISEKYWDMYNDDEIDMPEVGKIEIEQIDILSRWLHNQRSADRHTITDKHIRNARRAYYGMISYVDEKVGDLLSTLKETGFDSNTVVIFTSDHGEMLGERGMWYKQHFFERSARVPLIVSYPREYAPKRLSHNVSLVDLLPTIVDIAKEELPESLIEPIHGNSLVDLLTRGEDPHWPDIAISEYSGVGTYTPCRMVRRGSFKYIYTHGYPGLLYNLEDDPLELNDLAGKEEYGELEAELLGIILSDWNPDEIKDKVMASQKERLFLKEATAGDPQWAYMVKAEDEYRFVRNDGAAPTKARARFPYVEPVPFDK